MTALPQALASQPTHPCPWPSSGEHSAPVGFAEPWSDPVLPFSCFHILFHFNSRLLTMVLFQMHKVDFLLPFAIFWSDHDPASPSVSCLPRKSSQSGSVYPMQPKTTQIVTWSSDCFTGYPPSYLCMQMTTQLHSKQAAYPPCLHLPDT